MPESVFKYHNPPSVTAAEIDAAMPQLLKASEEFAASVHADSHMADRISAEGYKTFFKALYEEKLDKIKPGYFKELYKTASEGANQRSLGWVCEIALHGRLRAEDHGKVRKYLKALDEKRFDFDDPHFASMPEQWRVPSIQQFPDVPSLFKFVEAYLPTTSVDAGRDRDQFIKAGEINVVFESPALKVYTPLTESASQALGAGTQWCVSARDGCFFEEYHAKGPLLMVFPKSEKPIALHFATFEFRDDTDGLLNWQKTLERFPVLGRIGSWMIKAEDQPLAAFMLNASPSQDAVHRALCHDVKAVENVVDWDNKRRFRDLTAAVMSVDTVTPDTSPARIAAAISILKDDQDASSGTPAAAIKTYIEQVDRKLAEYPPGPLANFIKQIQSSPDGVDEGVFQKVIRPLAGKGLDEVMSTAEIATVKGNYLTIAQFPAASGAIQILALGAAKEALGRIARLAPAETRISTERAVKAFAVLKAPVGDVKAWLENHSPGRPTTESPQTLPKADKS